MPTLYPVDNQLLYGELRVNTVRFYYNQCSFMHGIVIDTIGWIGSVMVVLAYALNMYKRLAPDSLSYYLLNILGSACLILNTVYHHAIPSAVVNVIWVLIALGALLKRR
jgi:hypothetical protein